MTRSWGDVNSEGRRLGGYKNNQQCGIWICSWNWPEYGKRGEEERKKGQWVIGRWMPTRQHDDHFILILKAMWGHGRVLSRNLTCGWQFYKILYCWRVNRFEWVRVESGWLRDGQSVLQLLFRAIRALDTWMPEIQACRTLSFGPTASQYSPR